MNFFLLLLFLFFSACMHSHRSEISPLPITPSPINTSDSTSEQKLKITVLNVGQGDATLIQTPKGKTLLIDGGKDGKGREVILPYLKSQNIRVLDAIVATHYDADHIGGIDEVIAGEDGLLGSSDDFVPLLGAYDRGGTPFGEAPLYPQYLHAIENHRTPLNANQEIPLDSSLKIRCLSVNGVLGNGTAIDLTVPGLSGIENSTSIGLLIEYKKFQYFTAGDLTGGGSPGGYQTLDIETPLAEQVGPVDLVHVNHHGSSSSSHENYVNILQPKVALFNVGDGNDYQHPSQEVLQRWNQVGADLWLTEKGSGGFMAGEHVANGPIEIETDGEKMMINGQEYD